MFIMIGEVDSRTNFCNSFGLFLTKEKKKSPGHTVAR